MAWTAPAITLIPGTNVIAVYGTNAVCVTASDRITVVRDQLLPFVDITNANVAVAYGMTSYAMAGTIDVDICDRYTRLAGHYDVTFRDGARVQGEFDAPYCSSSYRCGN